MAVSASVHSPDNTNVPFTRIAERLQCFLITRAVMGGDRLRDAVELRHGDALNNPLFIGLCGFAAQGSGRLW